MPTRDDDRSRRFLLEVLDGRSYAAVGASNHVSRTCAAKRVQDLVRRIHRAVGVDGLDDDEVLSVIMMRARKANILAALDSFEEINAPPAHVGQISDDELSLAARRTQSRSGNPDRDVALLYVLFSTGARPLEVARLEVRDYLAADGSVRQASVFRREITVSGTARPLLFKSKRTCDAIDNYLIERVRRGIGVGAPVAYRGLAPRSRLFLTESGQQFEVVERSGLGKRRHLCRGILEVYRTIFRRAGLPGVTTLSARKTVARRLHERGARDDQILELLGLKRAAALKHLLSNRRRSLAEVVQDLV